MNLDLYRELEWCVGGKLYIIFKAVYENHPLFFFRQ